MAGEPKSMAVASGTGVPAAAVLATPGSSCVLAAALDWGSKAVAGVAAGVVAALYCPGGRRRSGVLFPYRWYLLMLPLVVPRRWYWPMVLLVVPLRWYWPVVLQLVAVGSSGGVLLVLCDA